MFADLLQNAYTYNTLLLHVSAIHFAHLQGANVAARNRTKIIGRPVCHLVTILTELLRSSWT
jgi:hypothetical protein